MSYKVEVYLPREKPSSNALRFETHTEADGYGAELLSRWFSPEKYEVVECEDPVNYAFREGRAVCLETA